MFPLWLGVLSLSLHSLIVSSSPIAGPVSRTTDAPASPCVLFHFKGQLYNLTYAPNPLFPAYLPTVDSAVREAILFIPSANASACSKHIGEFLLYAFLPQCFSFQTTTILVYPCADFCQRIRSCCESALLASYGITWPEWLNCDKIGAMVSNYQSACYSPLTFSDDPNCSPPPAPPTPQTDTTSAATSAPAFAATSVAASSSTSSPVVLSTTSSRPTDPSNPPPGCSHFSFSPWSEKYHDTTYFPNPLSPGYLPTVATALIEASRIFPIALSSNCSKYIGEFLLYTFFPQCYFSPTITQVTTVFPCEDFCASIQSCCSSVLASYGVPWPEWLDCGRIATATSTRNPNVCFRPPLNETVPRCMTTQPTSPPTTLPATRTPSPVTQPQSPPPCFCNSTCDSCMIRASITEATFTVQNFDYNFSKYTAHAWLEAAGCMFMAWYEARVWAWPCIVQGLRRFVESHL